MHPEFGFRVAELVPVPRCGHFRSDRVEDRGPSPLLVLQSEAECRRGRGRLCRGIHLAPPRLSTDGAASGSTPLERRKASMARSDVGQGAPGGSEKGRLKRKPGTTCCTM